MSNTAAEKPAIGVTVLGPCRVAYPWVFKPRMNKKKGEELYSCVLLIPKQANEFCHDPDKIIKTAREAMKAAGQARFGKETKFGVPLLDGDKEGKWPGYWYLNAKAGKEYPPDVVGPNRAPVDRSSGWAGGDWVKAAVRFYAGEGGGGKNVGAGLRALQFVAHDAHFAADSDVNDIFEDESSDGDSTVPTPGPDTAAAPVEEYDPFEDD